MQLSPPSNFRTLLHPKKVPLCSPAFKPCSPRHQKILFCTLLLSLLYLRSYPMSVHSHPPLSFLQLCSTPYSIACIYQWSLNHSTMFGHQVASSILQLQVILERILLCRSIFIFLRYIFRVNSYKWDLGSKCKHIGSCDKYCQIPPQKCSTYLHSQQQCT